MSPSLPVVAAGILKLVRSKKTSVKTAVYSSQFSNKKQLMSVVGGTVRYADILTEIMNKCKLQASDPRFKKNPELALVVLHRFLFSSSLNGCYTKYKKAMEGQKSAIHSAVERIKLEKGITNLKDSVMDPEDELPRYARVNTLLTSVEKAVAELQTSGYELITATPPSGKQFCRDEHISYLLVFPPGADLHANTLYKQGHLILQDKASCLPPYILDPPPGSHVIDSCAAPGNKTTQLAALIQDKGEVTAFDLSSNRVKILSSMVKRSQARCCRVVRGDFTNVDTDDYKKVEYILVDPSCSGSGISGRMSTDTEADSEERLEKLASFQSVILKKALSFPNVKRVVYSTCSIHNEENEKVVADVLDQYSGLFTLENIMPSWYNRGRDLDGSFPLGPYCIRASPEENGTIGFFVAMFKRKEQ